MVDGVAGSIAKDVMYRGEIKTCRHRAPPSIVLKIFASEFVGWTVGDVAAYTMSAFVGSTASAQT
jgi:hypothetical protein